MAFCTKCGASVEGDFCPQCGAAIGSPGTTNAGTGSSGAFIPPPPAPLPAKKKGRAIFWILGGCLGLVILGAIVFFSLTYFVFRKAGIDPDLMKSNPTLAVAKMVMTVNPDIEVLSVDEKTGIIRVRDKKTGKTMTMNLKDVEKGKIVFQDDKEGSVEIQTQGEGDNASVEVRSDKGTMQWGAGAKAELPSWLPSYRGATATGVFSMNGEDGKAGSCTLKTSDSPEAVASFYESALKQAGFTVQKISQTAPGQGAVIMLMAEDDDGGRRANVATQKGDEGTTITLTFENK